LSLTSCLTSSDEGLNSQVVKDGHLASVDGRALQLNSEIMLNLQLPAEQTFRRSRVQRLVSETFEFAPRIHPSLVPWDAESQMDSLRGFERHCQFLASSSRNPHSPASVLDKASILSIPGPCAVLKET
jgi:hypothetical protein